MACTTVLCLALLASTATFAAGVRPERKMWPQGLRGAVQLLTGTSAQLSTSQLSLHECKSDAQHIFDDLSHLRRRYTFSTKYVTSTASSAHDLHAYQALILEQGRDLEKQLHSLRDNCLYSFTQNADLERGMGDILADLEDLKATLQSPQGLRGAVPMPAHTSAQLSTSQLSLHECKSQSQRISDDLSSFRSHWAVTATYGMFTPISTPSSARDLQDCRASTLKQVMSLGKALHSLRENCRASFTQKADLKVEFDTLMGDITSLGREVNRRMHDFAVRPVELAGLTWHTWQNRQAHMAELKFDTLMHDIKTLGGQLN